MARAQSSSAIVAVPRKGIDQATREVNKTYLQELGPDMDVEPIEDDFIVPARTRVVIRSRVIGQSGKQLRSPTYMASVRRRHADIVAKLFVGLRAYEGNPDFSVYTFPVFTKIKGLLELLQPAREEGNARIILRMIRDTLMNGRWERYRIPDVRSKVAALIEKRLIVDEVTMADADATFDDLCELGLNPVGAEVPLADQDDEQEKTQVSD